MSKGVAIGLSNVHYALLTSDTVGNIVYETPVRIPGAITANINTNASLETLFADDGPYDTASTIGQISLELNIADLDLATQAVLLGHAAPVGGILDKKSTAVPPWVAIGFMSLKSNGKYRFVWLTKGKFSEPEMNHETKGDSINWQPPTISGSFVKRDADDIWIRQADEDDPGFVQTIKTGWFTDPNFTP